MVDRPGRAEAVGVRAGAARLRGGLGVSLALHATAVALVLSLVRPVPQPDSATAGFDLDLVMLPAEAPADRAPTDSARTGNSPAEPEPPPAAPEPEPPAAPPARPPEAPPAPPALPREAFRHPVSHAPVHPPARASAPPSPAAGAINVPVPPVVAGERQAVAMPPQAPPAPPAQSSPAWLAGVSAWLLAHRSYPEMARRLRQQGTVVVHFTADREGHVLEVGLVRSSGAELLDQAAQALLRNARLPAFPPDMKLAQQSLTVPIRYQLEW